MEALCATDPGARQLLVDPASQFGTVSGITNPDFYGFLRLGVLGAIQRQLKPAHTSSDEAFPWLGWVRWLVPVAGLAAVAYLILP